jgi:hypothetical protein
MGRFLSRGCPKGPTHFLVSQFLCSTWQPFLRPDPHLEWPARANVLSHGVGCGADANCQVGIGAVPVFSQQRIRRLIQLSV